MKNKIRLDHLVVERGFAESGSKAQALLLSGRIQVPGVERVKPGTMVSLDQPLELLEDLKFVSRGGEKLEAALDTFQIEVKNQVCLDVGASTGGFTDCLLQRGAQKVIAVDVGHGQLHWKLRRDERVLNLEKTHVLKLDPSVFQNQKPEFVSVDVSFISLEKVIPYLLKLLPDLKRIVVLIKPQFEAGPAQVPKGVVRDESVRKEVVNKILSLVPEWGYISKGCIQSPLKGPKGNIEYLLYMEK